MALRRSLFLAIILLTPLVIGRRMLAIRRATRPDPTLLKQILQSSGQRSLPDPQSLRLLPTRAPLSALKAGRSQRRCTQPPILSVSGITIYGLECYGGYLNVAYREEGPSYNTWEETDGVAFQTMHPLHNMLIRHRTWGDENDFQNHTFFELHPDLANRLGTL